METSPQEIKALAEHLQRSMLQILDLDPANGWYWITEAQARALKSQVLIHGHENSSCPLEQIL